MLRHALATLAYRTVKALRDAPARFPEFDPGKGVRGPHRLIAHMASDLEFARGVGVGLADHAAHGNRPTVEAQNGPAAVGGVGPPLAQGFED